MRLGENCRFSTKWRVILMLYRSKAILDKKAERMTAHDNAMDDDEKLLEKGIEAYQSREYATALDIFERLVRKGNAHAAFYTGHVYNFDTGYYDPVKALPWYRQAAEGGVVKAMFYVGQEYLFGKRTEQNIELGIFWLERCDCLYDANVRLAQVYMGKYGMEAIADGAKAFLYSRRVHEMDREEATEERPTRILSGNCLMGALLLGECHERGIGTPKDEKKAEQLYLERAESDYTAANSLGELCERQGRIDEAVRWYRKIIELAPRNEFANHKIYKLIGEWH